MGVGRQKEDARVLHIYIYIYLSIYPCVCVCVFVCVYIRIRIYPTLNSQDVVRRLNPCRGLSLSRHESRTRNLWRATHEICFVHHKSRCTPQKPKFVASNTDIELLQQRCCTPQISSSLSYIYVFFLFFSSYYYVL